MHNLGIMHLQAANVLEAKRIAQQTYELRQKVAGRAHVAESMW